MKRNFRNRVDESGFTIVEMLLGLLLFSMVAYASLSLMTMAVTQMTRVFGEYDSRLSVMMLLREMAEGTSNYGGFLAAQAIRFGPGADANTCDFEISVFGREVIYSWNVHDETIVQVVDGGSPKTLLNNVAEFQVSQVGPHTVNVTIAHRAVGYSSPIVRSTDGQPRNMSGSFAVLEACP